MSSLPAWDTGERRYLVTHVPPLQEKPGLGFRTGSRLLTGLSWGARFVARQLSAEGICKVGAVAHPSFLNESDVFGVNGQSDRF